jgi:hypothetical protein
VIQIRIHLFDDLRPTDVQQHVTAEIPSKCGPALRSAIEDISNTIGGRLVSDMKFSLEDALTEAATALAPLRIAINQIVPEGHPDYE